MEAVVKQEKPKNSIWHSVTETVDNILDLFPKYLDIYLQTQLTQGKAGEKQQGQPSVDVVKEDKTDTKTLLIVIAGLLGIVLLAKGK